MTMFGVVGCLAGPGPAVADEAFRGMSGGVNWGVEVVQTRLRAQQAVRWDYEIAMRETSGREIQFDQLELGAGGRLIRTVPIKTRLAPAGELRTKHWDRTPSGQNAIEVYRRYHGRDAKGNEVVVEVDLKLDPSVGLRTAAPTAVAWPSDLNVPVPPDIRLVSPSSSAPPELAAFAGAWRGTWGGPGGREALIVFEDLPADRRGVAAYAWGAGRDSAAGWERVLPVYREKALTFLQAGGGRVVLQLEPHGMMLASWRSANDSTSAVFTRLTISQPAVEAKGPTTVEQASRLNREAWDALQDGRLGEALPKAEEALAMREQLLGPRSPAVAESLNMLGEVYRAQGQLDEAERIHRRALALRESVLGAQHLDVATSLSHLAMLSNARAAYVEAETMLRRALAIADAAPPSDQRTRLRAELFEGLARVYRGLGRIAEAQEAQARAMILWTQ